MVYLTLAILVVLIVGVAAYLVNRKPKNLPKLKGGGGVIENPTYPDNEVIKEEQPL